jgi:hypothetical protein
MPPQYKDALVVVRTTVKSTGPWMQPGDKGTGICCWDSTSDEWVIRWIERGVEERWGDPDGDNFGPMPENYRWAFLPEGP